jgi:hypothetical protein
LLLLAFATPVYAAGAGDKPEKPEKTRSSKMDLLPLATLPATKYLTPVPFVVPLTRGNEMTGQYTLVVALELADSDMREELGRQLPKLRNEIYTFLLQSVTARSSGGQVPGLGFLQSRLLRIAQETAGPKIVAGVLIQEAYAGPAPPPADPRPPEER